MSDLIADSRDIVVQVFIGITPSIYMFEGIEFTSFLNEF